MIYLAASLIYYSSHTFFIRVHSRVLQSFVYGNIIVTKLFLHDPTIFESMVEKCETKMRNCQAIL